MIIKTINPGIYKIEVTVRQIIYGNTVVDRYIGWDEVEATTLKLRCDGCTIMIFKNDMKLFKAISIGDSFTAIVKEWKEKVYNFKKLVDNGIVQKDHVGFEEREDKIDFNYPSYYDEDDWLRDAAGTDDHETMNDVYWNLD